MAQDYKSIHQQQQIMSEDDSCYSTDQEYFLDICRAGQIEEIKEFISGLPENSNFDWGWISITCNNFIHMLSGNNHYQIFDYLFPIVQQKCPKQKIMQILNQQNSSSSTPLHYAVITESKQMLKRLIDAGADVNIKNQQNRTPFQEAEMFEKYEVAEILAPISANNLEALKKQVGDLKLNDSSDSEEQQMEPIPERQQKQQKEEIKQKEGTQDKKQIDH